MTGEALALGVLVFGLVWRIFAHYDNKRNAAAHREIVKKIEENAAGIEENAAGIKKNEERIVKLGNLVEEGFANFAEAFRGFRR